MKIQNTNQTFVWQLEQWDKVEEKYAVASLGVAAVVALWGSTGLISVSTRKTPLFFFSFFSILHCCSLNFTYRPLTSFP